MLLLWVFQLHYTALCQMVTSQMIVMRCSDPSVTSNAESLNYCHLNRIQMSFIVNQRATTF